MFYDHAKLARRTNRVESGTQTSVPLPAAATVFIVTQKFT
jgi:hypothetical protein